MHVTNAHSEDIPPARRKLPGCIEIGEGQDGGCQREAARVDSILQQRTCGGPVLPFYRTGRMERWEHSTKLLLMAQERMAWGAS